MSTLIKFLIEPFLSKKLRNLTVFVTSRCDSRCKHCFYWKNLGKTKDISLQDIRKISKSLGKFQFLNLSGGEPFLLETLPEICYAFYTQNSVRDISIPTNSMRPEKILNLTRQILEKCSKAKISINISLDGLEKTHDLTRGVKGAFKKAAQTIKSLTILKKTHPNFIVNVSTVVSNVNISETEQLSEFVKNSFEVDNHSFEVLRGNPKNKGFKPLNPSQFKKLRQVIVSNDAYYFKTKGGLKDRYLKKRSDYFFDQQYKALNNEKWDVPCLAGEVSAVIEPDGNVRPCELLDSIGNLKDFDYDFKKLWDSEKAKKIKQWIKTTRCSCTHCVALNASISHNPKAVFVKALLK